MKIDPNFAYDMFRFLHKPIRDLDRREGENFVERFLMGPQFIFEQTNKKIQNDLKTLYNPATIRADLLQYLKDQVGFTKELNNITNSLSTNDLRKLITLAVALWKQKGTEPGYINIVRLFTGKSARVFNWFDFRWIVGETQFGESQLGDDPFLISSPGIEGSQPINNVVALFTFENNAKDRSLTRNNGTVHGFGADVFFFLTPSSGFPQNSEYYVRFVNNVISAPNSSAYDFSGDITVEAFVRTTNTFGWATLARKQDGTGKGIRLEINTTTNELRATVGDGTLTGQITHNPASIVLNDGLPHHIAISLSRSLDSFRLFVDGDLAESSAETALPGGGSFGDMTNTAELFMGGSGVGLDVAPVDMDNLRIALNAVYSPDISANFPVPISGFIEYQEELLDEFQTDIRIVDEGTLNKTLILRILNLMRPVSERLNVIFVRFFDDFLDGIGQFQRVVSGPYVGNATLNSEQQMELDPNALFVTDVLGDADFQDILLQLNMNDVGLAGSVFSVLFFYQDADNFYEFRIDTINKVVSVHKTVAGVSSQIGADIAEDIVPGAQYYFTVDTSYDSMSGITQIQTFVDSNRQHVITDSSFIKGKFGIKSGAEKVQISAIEMMEYPTDVQRIDPGFDL